MKLANQALDWTLVRGPDTVDDVAVQLSHVVVLTDDLDGASAFLDDVIGMPPGKPFTIAGPQAASVFGWNAAEAATRGVMHGKGPGAIEFVEIPPPLRGKVRPGPVFLSFLTTDLDAALERVRVARGEAPSPIEVVGARDSRMKLALVPGCDTLFELLQP
jgi:catechol 2,3-dioxygenase-like lactoylglutathione lyase family enzyme